MKWTNVGMSKKMKVMKKVNNHSCITWSAAVPGDPKAPKGTMTQEKPVRLRDEPTSDIIIILSLLFIFSST